MIEFNRKKLLLKYIVATLSIMSFVAMLIVFIFGMGYGVGALIVLLVGHPIIFAGVKLQIIFGSVFVLVALLRRK